MGVIFQWELLGVYMWADITANIRHPQLSTHADAVRKSHYPHIQMRIAILKYTNTMNHIYI
jgi:hypothetical protein